MAIYKEITSLALNVILYFELSQGFIVDLRLGKVSRVKSQRYLLPVEAYFCNEELMQNKPVDIGKKSTFHPPNLVKVHWWQ